MPGSGGHGSAKLVGGPRQGGDPQEGPPIPILPDEAADTLTKAPLALSSSEGRAVCSDRLCYLMAGLSPFFRQR